MKIFLRIICTVLALGFVACEKPNSGYTPDMTVASLGTPPNDEIWFMTSDNNELIAFDGEAFNTEVIDIEYSELGISVIRFAESVTTIGAGAFDNCRNLSNISLPESVTAIEERAFFECTNLECMTLGSKIQTCGSQAFDLCIELFSLHISSVGDWCKIEFANSTANPLYYSNSFIVNGKKLNSITIPSWVSHIGAYAFCNCTTLSKIGIPAKVKSIGKNAFEGCENLTKVDIENIAAWCNISFATVSSNPLSIAKKLYINGSPATAVVLEGVNSIAPQAFIGCSNITSLIADNSLHTVGEEAFRGCINLSSIELGEGVTTIEGKAFMSCPALESAKCHAVAPPTLGDNYVFDYNAEGRKIYVPAESVDDYKDHEAWSRYADAIMAIQ